MGERLIKPYEISVWEERLIQDGAEHKFKEYKLAVIGSNTMTGLNKVYDPVFNKKTNGEKTLTFSLNYKYFDPYSENSEVINPFAALLINERKIKLHYDNKWYEFIIKEHTESSDGLIWTYTCQDAFVLELAKVGYNLEFSTDLNNNQGTATELAQRVLEKTDWRLGDSDIFVQLIEEPIYKAVLNPTGIEIINASDNQDVVPTEQTDIYVFYSYIANKDGENVQFIIRDKARHYQIDDKNVITDTNFRIKTKLVYDESTQTFKKDETVVIALETIIDNEQVNPLETQYHANRLAYGQLTTYDPVMDRVVNCYNIENNDEQVYSYTDYSYVTSTVLTNYITNGENFETEEVGAITEGNNIVQGWSNYTAYSGTKIPELTVTTRPLLDTSEPLVALENLSHIEGFLRIKFFEGFNPNTYQNTIFNSGIDDNASTIGSIVKGDKYLFRWRGWSGREKENVDPSAQTGKKIHLIVAKYTMVEAADGSFLRTIDPNNIILHFDGDDDVQNANSYISGGTLQSNNTLYVINDVIQEPSTKYIYQIQDGDSILNYKWDTDEKKYVLIDNEHPFRNYYYRIATAKQTVTKQELQDPNVDIGIFLYSTSNNIDGTWYYFLQDLQLTRYIKDTNGKPIVIGNIPTATSEEQTYYYVKPKKNEVADTIVTYKDLKSISNLYGGAAIKPIYNEQSEKHLSISVSQSNCFDALQTIAETFECWIDLDAIHDPITGEIESDEYGLKKIVSLKKYIGKDNWAGFKYGINLNTIERTIDSNEIVTKLIVDQTQADYTDEGFVSIQNAKSNPSGESYILNFDYYLNQGLIANVQQCREDLSLFNATIKQLNNRLKEQEQHRRNLESILTNLAAKRNVFTEYVDTAKDNINKGLVKFEQLTGGISYAQYQADHTTIEQIEDRLTENDSILDVIGELYVNSTVVNNYSGILTNIDQEYWKKRIELKGTESYNIIVRTEQDELLQRHVIIQASDYIVGLQFQLNNDSTIYEVTISQKDFDIITNSTIIEFIGLPNGYTIDASGPQNIEDSIVKKYNLTPNQNQKVEGVEDIIKQIQNEKDTEIDKFNRKYSRFIKEGTWNSTDYIDSELYYLDALQVSNTSAQPQITYTINVVEVSELEGLENYQFDTGDKTYVEDTEFFGWSRVNVGTEQAPQYILTPAREEVIISEVEWHLDEPENNTITVQNYKTRFEDLFQRMGATVQTVQYNEATYAKISSLLDANGTINQDVLLNSLNQISGQRYNLTSDGSVFINGGNLHVRNLINPRNHVIINSEGIRISSDGGEHWQTAIDGHGINIGTVYTGTLNTKEIIIGSTDQPSFRWDDYGISAYKKTNNTLVYVQCSPYETVVVPGIKYYVKVENTETYEEVINPSGNPYEQNYYRLGDKYDLQTYVRYDQYGLYGIKNAETFKAQSLEDIKDKAHFAVTWDGFFIRNSYEGGGRVEITSDNDFRVLNTVNDTENEKIKIGALKWKDALGNVTTDPTQGVGAPTLYGIRINNNAGEPVFVTDDNGNLHITGEITATSANFGELMTVGKNGDNVPFIAIDGRTAEMYSSNYSEGANVGWIINKDGDAVFNNITARGAIKTAVFEYAEIQAVGGIFLFRPSSTIRKATIAPNNTDLILEVEKPQLFIKIIYNKIENPDSQANPQDQGWYIRNEYGYMLSTDIQVDNNKEYFERSNTYGSWCKISNYISNGHEPDIAQGILVNNGLAHVYQVIDVNLNNKTVTLSGAAVMVTGNAPITTLEELKGGALVDIGRSDGSSNYGIGVNSSDNTVNLPARAISLFETNINTASGSQLKVTYNYRGILGTLPVLTYDGNNPQVNQLYHDYMEGTQGIYTDNMYIGSNDQYIAFYTAINNNVKTKHLKVNAKELTLKAGSFKPYEEDPNQNFIYLSNEDYTQDITNGIQINNSGIKTDWRLIIGKKFGVDKAGNLYADNAVIRGNIHATSGSFGDGAEIINGQFIVDQESVSGLKSALDESTGYVLTVETNYSNEQNVSLIAHLYYGNTEVTTDKPSSMFRWYRKSETLNYYITENPAGNPQEKGWYEKISEGQEDTYVLTTDTEVIEGKEYYEYTNIEPLGGAYSIIFDRNTAGYGTTIICRFNDEALLTTPDNYAVETPDNYLLTARV